MPSDTNTDTESKSKKVFRFNLSDNIYNLLFEFVKLHEYDDRKDYKEAWKEWYKKQNFNREYTKLVESGYKGSEDDFEKKIYTSARYYIPKKIEQLRNEINEKKEKKEIKRRNYINLDYELLSNITNHIEKNINNSHYKPSDGFDDFCKEYKQCILNETTRLIENNIDKKLVSHLIKKAYKNKYNQFIN